MHAFPAIDIMCRRALDALAAVVRAAAVQHRRLKKSTFSNMNEKDDAIRLTVTYLAATEDYD